MADQVEGVEIAAHHIAQSLKKHAVGLQLGNDSPFALGGVPALQEVVQRGELAVQGAQGVGHQGFGDGLFCVVR